MLQLKSQVTTRYPSQIVIVIVLCEIQARLGALRASLAHEGYDRSQPEVSTSFDVRGFGYGGGGVARSLALENQTVGQKKAKPRFRVALPMDDNSKEF